MSLYLPVVYKLTKLKLTKIMATKWTVVPDNGTATNGYESDTLIYNFPSGSQTYTVSCVKDGCSTSSSISVPECGGITIERYNLYLDFDMGDSNDGDSCCGYNIVPTPLHYEGENVGGGGYSYGHINTSTINTVSDSVRNLLIRVANNNSDMYISKCEPYLYYDNDHYICDGKNTYQGLDSNTTTIYESGALAELKSGLEEIKGELFGGNTVVDSFIINVYSIYANTHPLSNPSTHNTEFVASWSLSYEDNVTSCIEGAVVTQWKLDFTNIPLECRSRISIYDHVLNKAIDYNSENEITLTGY